MEQISAEDLEELRRLEEEQWLEETRFDPARMRFHQGTPVPSGN